MSRIPIIAVCQQNRTKNEDGSQDTTQIAQSDRLGQDCTVALFLDRDKNNKDMLKIYIGKSRDSVVGNTLCYQVDFNNGHWNYIPSEEASRAASASSCQISGLLAVCLVSLKPKNLVIGLNSRANLESGS